MSRAVPETIQLPEDRVLDKTLRPKTWDEFIGQQSVKKNLRILVEAAEQRQEPLDHILFAGPAGLGKTTLAHLLADTRGARLRITSGPAIEKVGDLAAILTNLEPNDVLFIDEAHRLPRMVEEILYPAMESRTIDIILGKGTAARTIQLQLPPFSLIAATTRPGLLSSPLRSRFGATYFLEFYTPEDIEKIITRASTILDIIIEPEALARVAQASRATPRVANRILKRVRDFAQVKNISPITKSATEDALGLLGIDDLGLEEFDRKILRILVERFRGGPAGLQAIAAACAEEEDMILEMAEPYLLRIGLLERTPRGRVATAPAYRHLGLEPPPEQPRLV